VNDLSLRIPAEHRSPREGSLRIATVESAIFAVTGLTDWCAGVGFSGTLTKSSTTETIMSSGMKREQAEPCERGLSPFRSKSEAQGPLPSSLHA
jgi:hypothetical protein